MFEISFCWLRYCLLHINISCFCGEPGERQAMRAMLNLSHKHCTRPTKVASLCSLCILGAISHLNYSFWGQYYRETNTTVGKILASTLTETDWKQFKGTEGGFLFQCGRRNCRQVLTWKLNEDAKTKQSDKHKFPSLNWTTVRVTALELNRSSEMRTTSGDTNNMKQLLQCCVAHGMTLCSTWNNAV